MSRPTPPPRLDLPLILGLFALFLFASPFTVWLARLQLPWFVPYAFWALVLFLAAWSAQRNGRNEP